MGKVKKSNGKGNVVDFLLILFGSREVLESGRLPLRRVETSVGILLWFKWFGCFDYDRKFYLNVDE